MPSYNSVAVIGAGAWGTALAGVAARAGREVVLYARNAASGGEEMLRLRAYEKLQNLVARGAVKKNGKKYKGLPSALAHAIAPHNGHIPAAAR